MPQSPLASRKVAYHEFTASDADEVEFVMAPGRRILKWFRLSSCSLVDGAGGDVVIEEYSSEVWGKHVFFPVHITFGTGIVAKKIGAGTAVALVGYD